MNQDMTYSDATSSDLPADDQPSVDPTAVIGRRIGAYVIDLAILVVIMVVFTAVYTISQAETVEFATNAAATAHCDELTEEGTACTVSGGTVTVIEFGQSALVLVAIAVSIGLTWLLPGFTGWTLGKLMVGLRVVHKETFEHAGLGRNVVRGLLWIVDSMPYVLPLVGLVSGLVSKGHRRVGDMVANTLVIRKEDAGRPVAIPGVNHAALSGPGAQQPPVVLGSSPLAQDTPSSLAPPAEAVVVAATAEGREPEPVEDEPQPAQDEPAQPEAHENDADQEDDESIPGVGAPHWDEARDTYIQWDPDLEQWMEWESSQHRWIPISQ